MQGRYAIFGAGSLGIVLGAYLSKNNVQIDLISRNKDSIEGMRKNGAKVSGMANFSQVVNALYPNEMKGKYDVIFLMSKQQDNRNIINFIKPFIKENGVLCTMQNGLPELLISEIIGSNRTLGCAIGWGATMIGGGESRLTSTPDHLVFSLGKNPDVSEEKFEEVKNILSLMGKVEVEENFLGARWVKLLINSAFSGLSTVFGCTFGEVARNWKYRKLAQKIMHECINVGHKNNIKFEPIQGINVVNLLDYHNPIKRLFSFLVIPLLMKNHKNIKASMLQDIEKGKKSEVDSINGVLLYFSRKCNCPTPVNEKVIKIIHSIEDGKYKPGRQNLQYFD